MRPVLLAAAALPAGFAVAELSGVRPLGGLVMALLGLSSLWLARPSAPAAAALVAVALGAFVASHAAADVLGTWGAVAAATALVGATAAVAFTRTGSTSR